MTTTVDAPATPSAAPIIHEKALIRSWKAPIALGAFDGRPALSVNRGFSAPVIVDFDRAQGELAWLAAHDDDPFARYEALQQLMLDTLVAAAAGNEVGCELGSQRRPLCPALCLTDRIWKR